MMQCHQCPHAEDVAAGKYQRAPFEETPCAKCKLVETSSSTVFFDDHRPGAAERRQNSLPDGSSEDEIQVPLSVLATALNLLLALPPVTREVVWLRLRGLTFHAIGRQLHIMAGAVRMRYLRALKSQPLLRDVFDSIQARHGVPADE